MTPMCPPQVSVPSSSEDVVLAVLEALVDESTAVVNPTLNELIGSVVGWLVRRVLATRPGIR